MKFLVHIEDNRVAYVVVEAGDHSEAREKGKLLAEKALNRREHDYVISALTMETMGKFGDFDQEIKEAFTEEELFNDADASEIGIAIAEGLNEEKDSEAQ